jgi:hypothetical protein
MKSDPVKGLFEQSGNLAHECAVVKLGAWFVVQSSLHTRRLSFVPGVNALDPFRFISRYMLLWCLPSITDIEHLGSRTSVDNTELF